MQTTVAVKLNDKAYDLMDVKEIKWKGSKTFSGYEKAETLTVVLWDGSQIKVEKNELDGTTEELLSDVAFPG